MLKSSGIDVSHYQIVAFALGSGIAGATGATMTHYIRFLSPDSFTFNNSIAYITMLVVGGRHTMIGGVLGAAFLTPLQQCGAPLLLDYIVLLLKVETLSVIRRRLLAKKITARAAEHAMEDLRDVVVDVIAEGLLLPRMWNSARTSRPTTRPTSPAAAEALNCALVTAEQMVLA